MSVMFAAVVLAALAARPGDELLRERVQDRVRRLPPAVGAEQQAAPLRHPPGGWGVFMEAYFNGCCC